MSRRRLGVGAEPIDADRCLDPGWIEWGGELIWAVGFTEGGVPYGLRSAEFEGADLEAMGLDPGLSASRDHEFGWWAARDQLGAARDHFGPEERR